MPRARCLKRLHFLPFLFFSLPLIFLTLAGSLPFSLPKAIERVSRRGRTRKWREEAVQRGAYSQSAPKAYTPQPYPFTTPPRTIADRIRCELYRRRTTESATPSKWELGPIMTFRSPTAAAAATEAGKEVIAPAKSSAAAAVATAVAAASERRLTRHRKIASAREEPIVKCESRVRDCGRRRRWAHVQKGKHDSTNT